jgi:hypothetical protein
MSCLLFAPTRAPVTAKTPTTPTLREAVPNLVGLLPWLDYVGAVEGSHALLIRNL